MFFFRYSLDCWSASKPTKYLECNFYQLKINSLYFSSVIFRIYFMVIKNYDQIMSTGALHQYSCLSNAVLSTIANHTRFC